MSNFDRNSRRDANKVAKLSQLKTLTSGLLSGPSTAVLGMLIAGVTPQFAFAQAVNLGPETNNIKADGLTKTKIVVQGARTSITTKTIAGETGFNSFSDFQQAAGTRVDLYVPDQAKNLVNIVRNGQIVINGTLNAYKDGAIGGNVFFANSKGFVVGKTGVVNVGKLSVTTPTKTFLDSIIRADGSINNSVASQLMSGVVPLSKDGLISISGKINADGGISLNGRTVHINGKTGPVTAEEMSQREKMESTVNIAGLDEGAALVSRGGVISIVSGGNTVISGTINASAKATNPSGGAKTTAKAGRVTIHAGVDIDIAASAVLSADAAGLNATGGEIVVKAGETLTAAAGSSYSAAGVGAGDGGFIELSGKTVNIGAVMLNLASDSGKAGTFLIDPIDLVINGGGTNIISSGANIILQADNSITIVAGGILDSRDLDGGGVSQGNSGNITVQAPKILLGDGSQVLAAATAGSGYNGGDILLEAIRTGGGLAEITLGEATGTAPVITGRDITLTASSTHDTTSLLVALPAATARITINSASITASGALAATATAEASGGLIALPVGVVVTNVEAVVDVKGASVISAASMKLISSATAMSRVLTQSLAPADAKADGAVAISTVNSTAISRIGDTVDITVTNALQLEASNTIVSTANATPVSAAFGASVGVSIVRGVTTAEIADAADVTAGSLALSAASAANIGIIAAAAAGGAQEPQDGSKADEYLSDPEYADAAETDGVNVSVVGALAISDLASTTSSALSSSRLVQIGGSVSVKSSTENDVNISADGSAVDSATGVGVALAINLARVANDAVVSQAVNSAGISIGASVTGVGNRFNSVATSGAGASNVGIAGSLAVNLIDTQSLARIAGGSTVSITGGGDTTIESDNQTEATAEAKPTGGGASGETVGIGASVALNILANRSTAEVTDGATLSGAGDITLAATATHSATTEAEAGSSGGISLTPALGLSMISNTTMARLGTGGTQTSSGNVLVSAMQMSATTTSASGAAAGSKAAVGAALALALVDDTVLATTARNVSATGTVGFVAAGASSSELTATASASGAAAADDEGKAAPDAKPDVDTAVTDELTAGSTKQKSAGVGDAKQQASTEAAANDDESRSTADSSGSKVSVAAAVGVNVLNSIVTAAVPDGVVISSGGALTLAASNNTDGKVTASGSAVGVEDESGNTPDPSAVGIGAGVAVNLVKTRNNATLGVAVHSLGGLRIAADKLDVAALVADPLSDESRSDVYLASATSGAGAGKIGIAGSVALNLIDTQSLARIAGGSTVSITGGGDTTIESDNQTEATAEAKPTGGGASGETVGIGASVALNILANRSTAEVADGATVSGGHDLTLSATAIHSAATEAEAGSSGGISLTPALGLSMINNTTTARLGTLAGLGTQTNSGDVLVSAMQTSATTTSASGAAAGSKAAVGAALALALVDDTVLATTARNVSATGTVGFVAAGASVSELTAIASASGAAAADDEGKAAPDAKPDVDTAVTDELTAGSTKQKSAGVGDAKQQGATDDAVADDGHSAKTSEGKVSVAAAIAVNVQTNSVTAAVPDSFKITSGGALKIAASANTDGKLTTNAAAVGVADEAGNTPDPSQVGIGAAVAVNVVKARNTASLGTVAGGHSLGGLTIAADKLNVAALMANPSSTDTRTDAYLASATSGAGGSKVGIAGSVALNLIDAETNARLYGSVSLTGAGLVDIQADEDMLATATAAPLDEGATGGKVGVGASVALDKIDTDVTAEVADGANLTNGHGLTVAASSQISTDTQASAGAAGGIAIDVSLALALLNENTTARIGSGAALSMAGGDVVVSASNSGSNVARSEGENKSGKVGVGASAALILGGGAADGVLSNTSKTSAVLARNATAGSLEISAVAERTYDAHATATAGGGNFSETDETKNDTTGGEVESSSALKKTEASQGETEKGTNENGNGTGKDQSKVSVAAAAGIAAVQDNVSASLAGVTVDIANAITVSSTNQTGVMTSGKGSASNPEAQTGVGIGVALGIINNKSTASIADGAHIVNSGALTVSAVNRENADGDYLDGLTALAFAGASSKKISIAGALAIGISTGDTTARIGDGVNIGNSGLITVSSDVTSQLSTKAVAESFSSGQTAVGASIALIVSEKKNKASIGSGNVIVSDGTLVSATNHKISSPTPFEFGAPDEILDDIRTALENDKLLGANNYYVEAIGGAAANSTAVQGSFGIMVIDDEVAATVGESQDGGGTVATSINARGGDVDAVASNDFLAKALTGALSLSGKTGIGVSANVIVSSGQTRGKIADSAVITNAGDVTVAATATQDIQSISITAAGGGTTAIAGVATVITTSNSSEAIIGDNGQISGSGAVNVGASNMLDLSVLAGGASGGGTTGVGGSAVVGVIEQTTTATIGKNTTITAGDVVVSADSGEDVSTLVVGLGVGGSTGVGGAISVYSMANKTNALIDDDAIVNSANNVGVLADDSVDMSVLAGAVGLSGSNAVGASVSVAVINNTTRAAIADGASITGRGTGAALAYVKDYTPTLTAYGTGVSNQTIKAADTGDKNVADTAGVDKDVLTSADARYMGLRLLAMERGATEVTGTVNGVIVNATGNTAQRSLVVGAAASGSNSVTLSASVPVITSSVQAVIGEDASININNNTGASATQAVVVSAAQDLYNIGIAGSVAVGGSAGIGAGIDVAIIDLTTKATVGDGSDLVALGDIAITARAHEDFVGAGASVGVGGTAGGAGGFAVSSLNSTTEASLGDSTSAASGANLTIAASDITRSSTVVGGIGVGGTAGIGASVGVGLLKKSITASVGSGANISAQGNGGTFVVPTGVDFADTAASRGVLIDAYSNESISVLGVAGGVGGTAGVAGNVTVEILDVTTLAKVGDGAEINTLNANVAANAAQDVTISARDSSSLAVIDAALGVGSYAGIAGAVDVAIIRNTTAASIGDGADVRARDGITVAGQQNVQTDSIVVSAAGALVGIAAGISVTSIGDGLDPDGEGSKNLTDDSGDSVGDFVQDGLHDNTVNSGLLATSDNADARNAGTSMQAKRNALDVSGQLNAASATPLNVPAGTSASIGSSDIDAGGSVAVQSRQTVETKFVAGALAAGGVGLGAGVGVTVIDTTNTAQIHGDNADLIKAGNMLVLASTKHIMDGKGLVAAVGGVAGAVALNVFTDTANTSATVSGVDGQVAGIVNVDAESETELTALSGAVGAGGSVAVAAGVAVGVIEKTTTAQITGAADIAAGDVVIAANSSEDIGTLVAGAAAGGAAGGAGTVAVLSITTDTTARIGAAAKILAQGNAAVLSNDRTIVDNLNLAAAAGGTAAVGAAVGVVLIDADTQALIEGGADVTALGNNAAQSYIVGYNGVFGAISTDPDDEEKIQDSDFKPDDIDPSKVSASTGSATALLTAEDAKAAGLALLSQKRTAVAQTASGKGVIVNATDTNALRSLDIGGAAAGTLSAAFSASVPVVTTNTLADIGANALINQSAGAADADQSIAVAAASDIYSMGISGAVAVGGVGGVGAGLGVAIISNTTKARVGAGAQLNAEDDVLVSAKASEDFSSAGVAGAVGGVASLAGGITTIVVTNVTEAELGGTTVAQGNVDVIASDITRTGMLAGSVAVGGAAGIGAAVGVISLDKTTRATIADNAQITAFGLGDDHTIYTGNSFGDTRGTTGGINVDASSAQSAFTLAIAGAAGLGAGVSGVVTVELLDIKTAASIGNNVGINQNGGNAAGDADQDVVVSARDTTVTSVFDGGFAAGLGAGLAGAVDVGVFKNATSASIGDGTSIKAKGDVLVSGLSNKAGSSTTVSGAFGLLGIAAGISVYSYGDGISATGEGNKKLEESSDNGSTGLTSVTDKAQENLNDGSVNDNLASSDNDSVKSISADAQAKRGAVQLTSKVTGLSVPAGTSANIGSATITSGGKVAVTSSDALTTKFTTGAIAGGAVGIGAGIGILDVDTDSTAQISGTSSITSSQLAVLAKTNHNLTGVGFAGSGGLAAAISADVAIITDNSSTLAFVDGEDLLVTGTVSVQADTVRAVNTQAKSAAIAGGIAVGASVAESHIGGSVTARMGSKSGNSSSIGSSGAKSGGVTIEATSNDTAIAFAKASGGGIGAALQGASGEATVSTAVIADVDASQIYSSSNVKIRSGATSAADATAEGIALAGGLAVAGSLGEATISTTSTSTVGGHAIINAASADVIASSVTTLAKAASTGASGAFIGITATSSKVLNTNHAEALVSGSTVNTTGAFGVSASNTTNQNANASGNAGGVVAAGANDARATSDTLTTAKIGAMDSFNSGDVNVTANGTDTNVAVVVSGSGGVVAGSAADGHTSSTSVTEALLGTGAALTAASTGKVTIDARHTTEFLGVVDSRQASLVGASGAELHDNVYSTVTAKLGDNVNLTARDMEIVATNRVQNYFRGGAAVTGDAAGWNVDSVSGGLGNFPSGGSTVRVVQTTRALIGSNSDVTLTPSAGDLSLLTMEAHNETIARQKVKLDSGGAIASASAEIKADFSASAEAAIGSGSQVVVEKGDIKIAAWSEADIDMRAAATTYGLAGAPSGKVDIVYDGNRYDEDPNGLAVGNLVDIGDLVRLEASEGIITFDGKDPTSGTLSIYAGKSLDGVKQSQTFNATLDIFNKTAIPIPASPDPTVYVNTNSLVNIGMSGDETNLLYKKNGVRAAGDITIATSRGNISATAVGTGKDIYREALAAAASAISNAFGGGDVSFDYHGGSTSVNNGIAGVANDGRVTTGMQSSKKLTVEYTSDSCAPLSVPCIADGTDTEIKYTITQQDVSATILDRVKELDALIIEYDKDPIAKAAYVSEIRFLQDKLVSLGLGSYVDGVFKDGVFVRFQSDPAAPLVAGESVADVFKPTAFAGPTPKAAALAVVDTSQSAVNTASTGLADSLDQVVSTIGDSALALTDGVNSTFLEPTQGLVASHDSAIANITTMFGYGNTDGQIALKGEALAAKNAATVASLSAKTYAAANATAQTTIAGNRKSLIAAEAALAAGYRSNNNAAITAAQADVAQLKIDISNLLNTVTSNNAQILSQSQIAKDQSALVYTKIVALRDSVTLTGTDAEKATITAAKATLNAGDLTDIANIRNSASSQRTTLVAVIGDSTGKISTLNGAGTTSLASQVVDLNARNVTLGSNQRTADNALDSNAAPTTFVLELEDTATRLGNIYVEADQLVGDGELNAPGNAEIIVTNKTSNTLKLGNMYIPTYDAGYVRFNGVKVDDKADVNSINTGGAVADLELVTALTSSRGLVEINSKYNPEDSTFFDKDSSVVHKAAQRIAPDIVLKSGAVIENTQGAVKLISSAGNIYVNGQINAGSVEILAKNGDFVASYVNGFNHIGGDPRAFTDKTDDAEVGPGITANGSISIAARYININSTIQSGIAQWELNLDDTPTLSLSTTQATDIGLLQADVNTAIAAGVTTVLHGTYGDVTLNMAPLGVNPDELAAVIKQYTDEILVNPNASPVRDLAFFGVVTQINIKDYLSGSSQGRLEFSKETANAYSLAHTSADAVYTVLDSVVSAGANSIGAAYDAKNIQYLVNGASVHGGYIQLFGQIINTSPTAGNINVLDGFGTIDITNSSNIDVVLKTLSTGDDKAGGLRGTAGVIDITDVIDVNTTVTSNPVVTVRNTVFTRDYNAGDANGQIRVATADGIIDNLTGNINYGAVTVRDGTTAGTIDGTVKADRETKYTLDWTPASTDKFGGSADQRYVWQTGEDYTAGATFTHSTSSVFGVSAFTYSDVSSYTLAGTTGPTAFRALRSGDFVSKESTTIGSTNDGKFVKGTLPAQTTALTRDNNDPLLGDYVQSDYSYITDSSSVASSSSSCGFLCITKTYHYSIVFDEDFTTIRTNSLKADYAIGINFLGSNTGSINVSSNSDVVLTNAIRNVAGVTTIEANGAGNSIINGSTSSLITSRGIDLTAGAFIGGVQYAHDLGAPGASEASIYVDQTGRGTPLGAAAFTATAGDGNVNIVSRSDLVVDHIVASGLASAGKGNVNLVAGNSILGHSSSSLIQGNKVNLTASSGAIGSTVAGGQLHVNSGFTDDPALRPFGADPTQNAYLGLSATAGGDIGIYSTGWGASNTTGTMLVDKVLSIGGDVKLTSTGHILDNNPVEVVDTRTYTALLGYWESLGLMEDGASASDSGPDVAIDGANNADKQANLVQSFEKSTTQSYQQYWEIRETQADGGAAYQSDFSFKLDTASQQGKALTKYYTDKATAAGSVDVAGDVAADIAAYNSQKTDEYHKLDAKVGGLTTGFDNAYAYEASAAEKAAMTKGAVWTERELAFAISPGALKTVTSTNAVLKAPNVAGRTVTIEASAGIGENTIDPSTGAPGISIRSSTNPRDLTLDQKVALAAAERSDLQLILDGAMTLTPVLKTDETAASFAGRVAAYDAAIAQGLDTYTGNITIALGADPDTLNARERAAFDAAAAGLFSADYTVLRVLSKRPLNFNATQALNVTVPPAGGGGDGTAYLASQGGAPLGAITTNGETRIKVRGSITNAAGGAAVSTGNLILEASQGSIGSLLNPLALDQKPGATTTARAQNDINIGFEADGNIDTIYSPNNVSLTANGSLTNANGDDLINILGKQVDLVAVSGALGEVDNYLNVGVNLGGDINATAGTGINLFGPSNSLFVVNRAVVTGGAGGTINLRAASQATITGLVETAGTINVASGARLVIASLGDIHSAAATVNIDSDSLKMLNGAKIRADSDKVGIVTDGNAQITGIVSGSSADDAVSITAGGGVYAATNDPRTDITAIAAGAGVKIVAGLGIGDKTIDNVTANGDIANGGNRVTDVANPLRIKTNGLDILATDGSIEIAALSSITGSSFEALNGAITVTGTGSLAISTATSGGSQSFIADGNVGFTQLTTLGLADDIGDVTVTSVNGALTGGNIDAHGSIFLSGKGVAIDTAAAAVDSTITSTGSGNDVTFTTVSAGNDSTITSDDDILGHTQTAGGTVTDTAGDSGDPDGDILIDNISATEMIFSATGKLVLPHLDVATRLVLQAGTVTAGITQVPSGPDPLELTLTGAKGTVGTRADITVDAPAGIVVPTLRFIDSTILTTARKVSIQSAYVPGSMLLTTPLQTIFDDNRSQRPTGGSNVQLYQPTYAFTLDVDNYETATTTYVVKYDRTSVLTDFLTGLGYKGISLVRDTVRRMPEADDEIPAIVQAAFPASQSEEEDQNLPDLGNIVLVIDGIEYRMVTTSFGPAVGLLP